MPSTTDRWNARKTGRFHLLLALLATVGCASHVGGTAGAAPPTDASPSVNPVAGTAERPRNPLDALRAYRYLEQICAIGTRMSGTEGMHRQQELLQEHFQKLGATVTMQPFEAVNPKDGSKVQLANMIISWHPERKERLLICTHYDTRPMPDRDPDPTKHREGIFLGANDGASGVAVLMELGNVMKDLDCRYGVDFVLLDGEELVYQEKRDPYFLGSTYFAKQYAAKPPGYKYVWGVLLDMVGDADLQLYQEQRSVSWRDTRPLVNQIWATAGKLGVKEFIPRAKYEIQDDHLPLRNIAKIPTCDVIDFDYPAWHTADDTPRRCSGSSLAKVGWVLYEWMRTAGPAE